MNCIFARVQWQSVMLEAVFLDVVSSEYMEGKYGGIGEVEGCSELLLYV